MLYAGLREARIPQTFMKKTDDELFRPVVKTQKG